MFDITLKNTLNKKTYKNVLKGRSVYRTFNRSILEYKREI